MTPYSTITLNKKSKPGRAHKSAFFGAFARVGKALGHPTRLELLDLLAQTPRTVEALARECDRSLASTSQHLQVLWRAGLVTREQRGLYVTYALASPAVAELTSNLERVAHRHLAEVEQAAARFLHDDAHEPIERAELTARLRTGEAILIDVRPAEEFEAAHLPQAISIPLAELEARLASLPDGPEIIAYCRGPYCVLAVEAVKRLRASGRSARRLEAGVHAWSAGR